MFESHRIGISIIPSWLQLYSTKLHVNLCKWFLCNEEKHLKKKCPMKKITICQGWSLALLPNVVNSPPKKQVERNMN
jgi:hypothetical protein